MELRTFGRTGKNVFVTGIGTYGHGDAYGGISREESIEIFRYVIRNTPKEAYLFIDTAPLYGSGECEKNIGVVLKEYKNHKVLLGTKGGRHITFDRFNEKDFSHHFLEMDLNKSLKRLDISTIFLYQLHNPDMAVISEGSVFKTLEEFRRQKKISYYGVSIDHPDEGVKAIDVCRERGYTGFAAIQVIYNILNKKAESKLFKKAKESGIAIIAREPLLRGFLSGKRNGDYHFSNAPPAIKKIIDIYGEKQLHSKVVKINKIIQGYNHSLSMSQVAIKYSISNSYVTVSIPGTNKLDYIKENFYAAEIDIKEELLRQLSSIEDIKIDSSKSSLKSNQ